jgi:hypothetical protein
VRWVFPHAKLHDGPERGRDYKSPWSGLSPEDIAVLEPEDTGVPYITQIILREATLIGSLDKIIVGGQGETAVAAHDAITSFPEITSFLGQKPDAVQEFIPKHLPGQATELGQPRLAGFVGMHAPNKVTTRDQRGHWLTTQFSSRKKVNECIVTNTHHQFIHGGFKTTDHSGDGCRIDEFEAFLASAGVVRADQVPITNQPKPKKLGPVQAPETQDDEKAAKLQHELSERDKHLGLIKKQKAQTKEAHERAMMRIRDDRIERRVRKERQRQKLVHQQTVDAEEKGNEPPPGVEDPEAAARRQKVADYYE